MFFCILFKGEPMSTLYKSFLENFPDEFSIAHKIAPQTEKKTFHMHKQLEVIYTISSNMKCRTEKGIRSIPKNSLVLLNSMDLHYFFTDPGSGLCDRYVLYFSPSFISPLSTQEVNLLESFNVSRMEHPIILSAPECQQTHWLYLMDQMISQLKLVNSASPCQDSFGTVLHIKFLLGQFLLMVNQLYWQSYGNVQSALYKNHSHLVMEICEFIHSHIQCPISSDSLADHFHISKTQLYYLFKEVLGTTAGDFLIECRMTCAKNYLINSEYSVEMISELVGYHNLSSFSRTFKALSDCSPLQYRKKHKLHSPNDKGE